MDTFTDATIQLLSFLSNLCGGYGLGIIALTIIVRLLMWPLSVSQQRSMKVMQKMQPKMKMIQDRYKDDPQTMQRKMMEFYKENNFNPMSGCFPVLIQLPIFILLYQALISPQFIDLAGNAKFLFINRLDATIKGTVAPSYDGEFMLSKNANFNLGKKAIVYFSDGTQEEVKVKSSKDNLRYMNNLTPGDNIEFKLALSTFPVETSENKTIQGAEADITNVTTREIEKVKFDRKGDILVGEIPSKPANEKMNYDVLALVIIFGASMWLATKIMTLANKNSKQQLDPQQEAMQKTMGTTMPIFLTATFLFIPIPAGVLLYLVASNIVQIFQTFVINKQLEKEDAVKSDVIDVKAEK
ncbi:MAG: YidC/Oxa1 family membrane protein insertase [Candidatus Gastranaerophilales bacterium]|nr:YidC/Oxa1 family membrane protein insertase [Candidatus Gastranaerophilales bacterium]